jgi:diketogulonate reductase-like aldo/keto reductase
MSTQQTAAVPTLQLNDAARIPQLGFGVFQVPPDETAEAVQHALKTGYRSIDTAAAYGNEAGVADGIERSGLAREDVFLTTKLFNNSHGAEKARRAFEHSLEELRSEYVDLYLIHWPVPSQDEYVETWEALTEFKRDGRARSIGVSNFLPEHLGRIIDATGVVPAVNQVELHPWLQQPELRAFHEQHGIRTEAWSPLGQGQILDEPAITEIAQAHDRTPAQVIIRWHLQIGNVVIPKSVTPERIEENFDVFGFELTGDQIQKITELDRGERIGPDPATFVRP